MRYGIGVDLRWAQGGFERVYIINAN